MEIPKGFIEEIGYLKIFEKPYKNQEISICQNNKGGNMNFIKGNINSFFGTYILFNMNETYEDNPICTPIISYSKDPIGDIVAIKQSNSFHGEDKKYYSGLNINIVLLSINSFVQHKRIKPSETLSQAKKLSLHEINLLEKEGLKNS